jgi:membrane-associated HD superfamily phosphohydrolase
MNNSELGFVIKSLREFPLCPLVQAAAFKQKLHLLFYFVVRLFSVLTIFFLSFLRLEVECKTSERNLKKSKDKWEAYDSEVSEAETKLREMNKERESLENEGEKIVESVKNFEKEMDEVTTSLKEVKESLTKLEEYETQYKSERIEIDQANEKFAAALKENTKTIQHWRREIAKLRLVFYIIFFIIRHYKKGT